MSALVEPPTFARCTAIVLRAPDAAWDGANYIGAVLQEVDESAAAACGLSYRLVRKGQFCAVAASSLEAAQRVHAALRPQWSKGHKPVPPASNGPRPERGLRRQYLWQAGPEAGGRVAWRDDTPAQARWDDGALTIRAHTGRNAELAREAEVLFGLAPGQVKVVGRPAQPDQALYDAAIDAAIVARELGCSTEVWPVRRLDAEQTLSVSLEATRDDHGGLVTWTILPGQPDALRASAAAVTLGQAGALYRGRAGLRAGYAPHEIEDRPAGSRLLEDALPAEADLAARLFAQESFADECARAEGTDPVQWRLARIKDPVRRTLVEQVAAAADWQPPSGGAAPEALAAAQPLSGVLTGRGFACAELLDESLDTPQRAWAAWVVDVSVEASTGQISLDKITVGHHLDELVIADARDPRWGRELERAARGLLSAPASHDSWSSREAPASRPAPSTALTGAGASLPAPSGLSASAAIGLPAAAAVANAIYDATGVRLREAPFHLAGVQTALALAEGPKRQRSKRARRAWGWPLGIAGGLAGAVMAVIPWRAPIAPVTPDLSIYSSEAIERGRLVAAAGDCMVCHTAEGGQKNAGGRAMDTPFGIIYTTNITSDPETGIGNWSYAAFERAMRQGISRDGRHLYPAFPYTSFAKLSDGDMQALYAYLMSEPPVKSETPQTRLAFPYNVRPMMAYWNLLFHKNQPYVYDDTQSQLWNRGAYLVQGPGHCMACHSPRNALGAEKNGPGNYLAGGVVDGWVAPALDGSAPSAVPWTAQDIYDYLRSGHSARHGVAAGPMAPVVESLQALPDRDIQAMAVYLDSLKSPAAEPAPSAVAGNEPRALSVVGKNLYEGACAACHDANSGMPLFGVRPSLMLNGNVTADAPDNLIRIVLEGIEQPADSALGYMPGFADTFNDGQLIELIAYLRGHYAPERPAWGDLAGAVRRVRAESVRHATGAHP